MKIVSNFNFHQNYKRFHYYDFDHYNNDLNDDYLYYDYDL